MVCSALQSWISPCFHTQVSLDVRFVCSISPSAVTSVSSVQWFLLLRPDRDKHYFHSFNVIVDIVRTINLQLFCKCVPVPTPLCVFIQDPPLLTYPVQVDLISQPCPHHDRNRHAEASTEHPHAFRRSHPMCLALNPTYVSTTDNNDQKTNIRKWPETKTTYCFLRSWSHSCAHSLWNRTRLSLRRCWPWDGWWCCRGRSQGATLPWSLQSLQGAVLCHWWASTPWVLGNHRWSDTWRWSYCHWLFPLFEAVGCWNWLQTPITDKGQFRPVLEKGVSIKEPLNSWQISVYSRVWRGRLLFFLFLVLIRSWPCLTLCWS